MSVVDLIKADAAALLHEMSVPIVVRLNGVLVKTVDGVYIPEVESVTEFGVDKITVRPLVVLHESAAAGITRNHTLQPPGLGEKRIFGAPQPATGLVKFFLVQ